MSARAGHPVGSVLDAGAASGAASAGDIWEPAGGSLTVASKARIVATSVAVGLLLAVVWSFEFVDQTIGDNVANSLLGDDARGSAIGGSVAGAVFAFVSGLAATFTACNIAAFSAVAPMVGEDMTAGDRLSAPLRPLGWLAVGMLTVSGVYGAVGALLGDRLPQLSTATTVTGMPVRLAQASMVFGVVGVAFVHLGLVAVGAVPDPLARLRSRLPQVDLLVVGGLIGAFLIGRPFGLFVKMFRYAAERHDPVYGALTFMLQSFGNIVVIAGLFLLLIVGDRGRIQRWLARRPGRLATVTGSAFLAAGSFTFVYWVLRVPAVFGYGWFPRVPWS